MNRNLSSDLIDLLKAGRFDAVVSTWLGSPVAEREDEGVKRIAAAAFAQGGNLTGAYELLAELGQRASVALPTLMLAGRVAFDLRQYASSVDHFERAVALARDNVSAWTWLADAALAAREPERALRGSEVHALWFLKDADLALRHVSLLALAGRCDEALIGFERILARWPGHPAAGPAFAEFVMREFPITAADLLVRTPWRPIDGVLTPELARALLWLPAIYATEDDASAWRNSLVRNLQSLTSMAKSSPLSGDSRAKCLATTPFFAAYHDADVTQIQCAWGDFVEALAAPLRAEYPCPERSDGLAIRTVGVVSNRLTDSSAGRYFNSWLASLRAANFAVRLYAIGSSDHVTDELESQFPLRRFPVDDVTDWRALAAALHNDANDVLIYPEPQGSQLIQLMAGMRLAPMQFAAFGNPLTTGLRTMDYFFVPDDAEVQQPEAFYRERVVRLSGLGTTDPVAPSASAYGRAAFGVGEGRKVILVSQQLQKWTPTFVAALTAILVREPNSILMYFAFASSVSVRAFERYLRDRFAKSGLEFADRTVALAMLSRDDYLAAHRCADVALDTFGFSGGSSTFDAVSVNLAVVSLEGRFLRSRQSAAILRAAGQDANVVQSVESFIERTLFLLQADPGTGAPCDSIGRREKAVTAVDGVFATAAAFLQSLPTRDRSG